MKNIKVKICGIRMMEAAKVSIQAGADFLGFNFVPTSKRFINPKRAKKIIGRLSKSNIKLVGIFQNEKIDVVNNIINFLELDYVQLHGSESQEYIDLVNGAKIIKTISLSPDFNIADVIGEMKKYRVDCFLLDRLRQGEGKKLNLNKVRQLASLSLIILAGGLTPENVKRTLSFVAPYAVDVAGGVETNGKKDAKKIERFMREVKNYE